MPDLTDMMIVGAVTVQFGAVWFANRAARHWEQTAQRWRRFAEQQSLSSGSVAAELHVCERENAKVGRALWGVVNRPHDAEEMEFARRVLLEQKPFLH